MAKIKGRDGRKIASIVVRTAVRLCCGVVVERLLGRVQDGDKWR